MNKFLRILRTIVSLIVFITLGVGFTFPVWMLPRLGAWFEKIQIEAAVGVMSLTVFVVWLLITLVFGRIYCSSVCPLGTLQDVAARCMRIGRFADRRPYRFTPGVTAMRYAVLLVVAVCLLGGFVLFPSVVDPLAAFQRICAGFFNPVAKFLAEALGDAGLTQRMAFPVSVSVAASIIATFLFAVTVVIAAQSGRTICNTVCPVGTILGSVSRYSIFQFDIDTDKCTNCRRCEYVCKAHCIDLGDHVVDGSRCVGCFNCIDVCRDDAIRYTTDRKRLSQPLMQRIRDVAGKRETETETTMETPDKCRNNNHNSIDDETVS